APRAERSRDRRTTAAATPDHPAVPARATAARSPPARQWSEEAAPRTGTARAPSGGASVAPWAAAARAATGRTPPATLRTGRALPRPALRRGSRFRSSRPSPSFRGLALLPYLSKTVEAIYPDAC